MAPMGDGSAAYATVADVVEMPAAPSPATTPRRLDGDPPVAPPSPAGSKGSAGDVSCAICLEHAEQEELAMVKGCDHSYCVNCILRWAAHRERPTCPQCKQPFEHLFTYRRLDGGLHDFPVEESVTLLKRAVWFTNYMLVAEDGRRLLGADDGGAEWREYTPYGVVGVDHDYDDDEAVEDYYMSAAAGRARVIFGNRRWGNSGYVAAGRQVARPSPQPRGKKGKKGRGSNTSNGGAATSQRGGNTSAKDGAAVASPSSEPSSLSAGAGLKPRAAATPLPAGPTSSKAVPDASSAFRGGTRSGLSSALAAADSSASAATAVAAVAAADAASGSSDGAGSSTPSIRASAGSAAETKPIPVRRHSSVRGWESAVVGGSSSGSAAGAAMGTPAGTSPGASLTGGSCGSSAYGSSPGGYMERGLAPGRRARRAMRREREDGIAAGTTPPGSCSRGWERRPAPVPVPDSWEASA